MSAPTVPTGNQTAAGGVPAQALFPEAHERRRRRRRAGAAAALAAAIALAVAAVIWPPWSGTPGTGRPERAGHCWRAGHPAWPARPR
jgi:ferric-dicitrate binding protein FerR (iron transport regulator)